MAGMPPQQGFPRQHARYASEPTTGVNGMAIASLVLGLVSLFTCFMLVPQVLAIIFGIVSWAQMKSSQQTGRGFAAGGIATGALSFLLLIGSVAAFMAIPNATVTAGEDLSEEKLATLRALEHIGKDEVPVMVVGGGWMDWASQSVVLRQDELVTVDIEGFEDRIFLKDIDEIDLYYFGSDIFFDTSRIGVESEGVYVDVEVPGGGPDVMFFETLDRLWRAAREAAGRPVNDDDEDEEDDSEEAEQTAGQQA